MGYHVGGPIGAIIGVFLSQFIQGLLWGNHSDYRDVLFGKRWRK